MQDVNCGPSRYWMKGARTIFLVKIMNIRGSVSKYPMVCQECACPPRDGWSWEVVELGLPGIIDGLQYVKDKVLLGKRRGVCIHTLAMNRAQIMPIIKVMEPFIAKDRFNGHQQLGIKRSLSTMSTINSNAHHLTVTCSETIIKRLPRAFSMNVTSSPQCS